MHLPKGITERKNSYRARVSINGITESRDFNFRTYSKEIALEYAIKYLEETRTKLIPKATGLTSKYRVKAKEELTIEKLKEILSYDSVTGLFTWLKKTAACVTVGDVAGCFDADGYVLIGIAGKMYKAHRLAFALTENSFLAEDIEVDHINRITSDNRWANLRKATRSQNQQNKVAKQGILGIKGLSLNLNNNTINAVITLQGKTTVKVFPQQNLLEAKAWIKEQRTLLHGEFANHG